jgi:cell division protein FtsI (penicillin-binding protein 3)
VLSAAVFYRQVVETDYLRSEGERRYLRVGEIAARRGMITDRNGEPLAVSTPVETVWGEPRKLVERRDAIPPLAIALGLEPKELQERLDATSERGFLYLKRRVSFEEARAVRQVIADHDLAAWTSRPSTAASIRVSRSSGTSSDSPTSTTRARRESS